MAISAVVESLDSLPEAVREHFVAGTGDLDGKFILEVAPVDGVDLQLMPQAGLKSALQKERESVAKLKKELHTAGKLKIDDAEYDESAVRALIEKAEKLEAAGGDPDSKIAALRADLETQFKAREASLTEKYTNDVTGAQEELSRIQGIMKSSAIEAQVMRALQKHKGNPVWLAPHIKQQLNASIEGDKVSTYVMGEDGQPRISMRANSTDSMDVDELVESMKTHPDFAGAFEGSGASGTGNRSGGLGGGSKVSSDAPISERTKAAFD